jgi:RNA recognition motif-containing protein
MPSPHGLSDIEMNNLDRTKKSRIDGVALREIGRTASSSSATLLCAQDLYISNVRSNPSRCVRHHSEHSSGGVNVSDILDSAAQVQDCIVGTQLDHFRVTQDKCAIVIRNLPPHTTSNELTMFIQKRIQLAFKEDVSDIIVVSCLIFDEVGQAIMEFRDQRLTIRALSLKNKLFNGSALEFLPWKKRQKSPLDDENENSFVDWDQTEHGVRRTQINRGPSAVYVTHLPKNITSQRLTFFLTEMMKVAYKEIPVILACNICPSRADAYVEFESYEQATRAVNLKNRVFEGNELRIIPWDPKLLSMDWSGEAINTKPFGFPDGKPDKPANAREFSTAINPQLQNTLVDAKQHLILNKVNEPLAVSLATPAFLQNENSNHEKSAVMVPQNEGKGSSSDEKRANILKRQLDAMRLDRDHWKCAHDEAQERLKELTAELASTRAKALSLQEESNVVCEGQWLEKLAEAEQRFRQIANSLSEQSQTLNAVIQENFELKAQLNNK